MDFPLTEPTVSETTFTEWSSEGAGMIWKVSRILEAVNTPFQHIELFETPSEGKLLVHDGAVMLCERFEHTYHEMLVHPALTTHPGPKKVLVVGGGDGGTLREIIKHDVVELARQYEIDGEVVRIAKEHLPDMAVAYDDPRVDLRIEDGIKAVHDAEPGTWDIALIDSTDPVGPAEALFEDPFYAGLHRVLGDDGILVTQVATYAYHLDHLVEVTQRLQKVFPLVRVYQTAIPMYPSGTWCFVMASKGPDPLNVAVDESDDRALMEKTVLWNRGFHNAAFALPTSVLKALEG